MDLSGAEQLLIGGGGLAVTVAVIKATLSFHERELARVEKLVGTAFTKVDEEREERRKAIAELRAEIREARR